MRSTVTALITFFALALAAALEVGGDALVRYGMYGTTVSGRRALVLVLGAVVLFAYSLLVNAPRWEFGRLMGVYIALFFVVSQIVAAAVFKEPMKVPTLVGEAFIVAGGLILTFWRAT